MSDYGHRKGGLPDLVLWRMSPTAGTALHNTDVGDVSEHACDASNGDLAGSASINNGGGEARFVEVKSPNDRLSDKQKIWLHVLQSVGANVAVAKVDHVGGLA